MLIKLKQLITNNISNNGSRIRHVFRYLILLEELVILVLVILVYPFISDMKHASSAEIQYLAAQSFLDFDNSIRPFLLTLPVLAFIIFAVLTYRQNRVVKY